MLCSVKLLWLLLTVIKKCFTSWESIVKCSIQWNSEMYDFYLCHIKVKKCKKKYEIGISSHKIPWFFSPFFPSQNPWLPRITKRIASARTRRRPHRGKSGRRCRRNASEAVPRSSPRLGWSPKNWIMQKAIGDPNRNDPSDWRFFLLLP